MLAKINQNFGQKSKFWSKNEIFVKNPIFRQKTKFSSKIQIFVKNLNFLHKIKFCSKIKMLTKIPKNRILSSRLFSTLNKVTTTAIVEPLNDEATAPPVPPLPPITEENIESSEYESYEETDEEPEIKPEKSETKKSVEFSPNVTVKTVDDHEGDEVRVQN